MRRFIEQLAGPLDRQTKRRPQDRRGQHLHIGCGQHAGLLLQRYLCGNATGENGNAEEKRAILLAAINAASNTEVREFYKGAFARWEKALPELTASNELQTQGRLIVGLGSENILETGIRLHHTYGLPILPGSALKGLAAHYCDQVWGPTDKRFKKPAPIEDAAYRKYLAGKESKPEDSFHRLWFGNTDDSGCITFHDAWLKPDSPQPLKLDVMTPHHLDYNRDPKSDPKFRAPTDFDSPTPVPFLSVMGKFHVAASWHGPEDYEKSVAWTEMAFELLLAALADWGIGGKTTSGYGRMTESVQSKWKKPFSATALGLPNIGAEIDATLLDVPKRDKPWRAKILLRGGKALSGPIDGAPPTTAILQPAKPVRVIVTEVGERSIKFMWPQLPKK